VGRGLSSPEEFNRVKGFSRGPQNGRFFHRGGRKNTSSPRRTSLLRGLSLQKRVGEDGKSDTGGEHFRFLETPSGKAHPLIKIWNPTEKETFAVHNWEKGRQEQKTSLYRSADLWTSRGTSFSLRGALVSLTKSRRNYPSGRIKLSNGKARVRGGSVLTLRGGRQDRDSFSAEKMRCGQSSRGESLGVRKLTILGERKEKNRGGKKSLNLNPR